eukprot:scaffold167991_cov18-Tisochrysis_lutea.AAC.3
MESTTLDASAKFRDLSRLPLSIKRLTNKESRFTLDKSSTSFGNNSPNSNRRVSPGIRPRTLRREDSSSGVRQRMAGPTDVEAWAVRLRARANWRKAGMLTLPNHSPAFMQLCAVTEETMKVGHAESAHRQCDLGLQSALEGSSLLGLCTLQSPVWGVLSTEYDIACPP